MPSRGNYLSNSPYLHLARSNGAPFEIVAKFRFPDAAAGARAAATSVGEGGDVGNGARRAKGLNYGGVGRARVVQSVARRSSVRTLVSSSGGSGVGAEFIRWWGAFLVCTGAREAFMRVAGRGR